jgi:hypothetical protein
MRRLLLVVILFGAANAYAAPVGNIGPMSDVELASFGRMAVPYADGRLVYYSAPRDAAKAAAYERQPAAYERKAGAAASESLASMAFWVIAVAACGFAFALGAVGLQSLWVQHPIRDPYQESSEEGCPPAV